MPELWSQLTTVACACTGNKAVARTSSHFQLFMNDQVWGIILFITSYNNLIPYYMTHYFHNCSYVSRRINENIFLDQMSVDFSHPNSCAYLRWNWIRYQWQLSLLGKNMNYLCVLSSMSGARWIFDEINSAALAAFLAVGLLPDT